MHNNTNIFVSLGAAKILRFNELGASCSHLFLLTLPMYGVVRSKIEIPLNQVIRAVRLRCFAWLSYYSSHDIMRSLPLKQL